MDLGLWQYLPDYAAWSALDYVTHSFWGLIGALVRISHSNTPIAGPSRDANDAWKLNGIGTLLSGIVVGMLVNHNPLVGVCAAIGSPELIEFIVGTIDAVTDVKREGIKEAVRKWLNGSNI